MELELLAWGDGTIRLTYWDSLHGNDRVFVLGEDGRTYESDHADEETLTQIDLIAELRKMASTVD